MSRFILLIFILWTTSALAANQMNIPILTYHNFDPTTTGSMMISTTKFEEQLKWLKDNGYTVIPMKDAVDYLQGKIAALPTKPVVITVDDGRVTVYQYMLPIVLKYHIPVTLFIYPSCISRVSYALTWDQLKELQKTGLFDIQSHTYWHPNFNQEKKHLSSDAYRKFVHDQLVTSKKILEDKLSTKIVFLAWPYGIYDKILEEEAEKAGYVMAFSVDDRSANKSEKWMAEPRFVILEKYSMKTFIKFMEM